MDELESQRRLRKLMPGLILVGIGVLLLVAQFVSLDDWFLFLLGIVFFVAYFLSRIDGLLWPAGVLTGLGAGILIGNGFQLDGSWTAAVILFGLAVGFLSIYVIDRVFTPPTPVAPLWAAFGTGIAGAIMLLTGLNIVPENIWTLLSQFWPLILIIIGVSILWGALRREA